LAANPDVKAIVFVQAVPGAAAAIDKVRETRPDMLFIAGVAAEDGYHVWQLIVNKLARRRADYDLAKPLVCIGLAGLAFAATFIPAVEDILLFVRIPVTTYLAIAGLCLFRPQAGPGRPLCCGPYRLPRLAVDCKQAGPAPRGL
jgi:hypothetical protein